MTKVLKGTTLLWENWKLKEVSSNATTDCIFYKKVAVTRHNGWIYYDMPKDIIPVAVRINGELNQFDWNATITPKASFTYEKSGEKVVINKSYTVSAGGKASFDLSEDNLNTKYNEVATKIGHYFDSRNNGNTCYIRVYKWLEKG